LVGHHLGVDAVALRTRLVGDPGEHHGLAGLELDAARERGALADLDVLGHPFAVIQRAMLAPDLAGLPGHAAVSRKVLLRHRDDKSIDIRHARPSLAVFRHCEEPTRWLAMTSQVWQQAALGAGSYWSRSRSQSIGYGRP